MPTGGPAPSGPVSGTLWYPRAMLRLSAFHLAALVASGRQPPGVTVGGDRRSAHRSGQRRRPARRRHARGAGGVRRLRRLRMGTGVAGAGSWKRLSVVLTGTDEPSLDELLAALPVDEALEPTSEDGRTRRSVRKALESLQSARGRIVFRYPYGEPSNGAILVVRHDLKGAPRGYRPGNRGRGSVAHVRPADHPEGSYRRRSGPRRAIHGSAWDHRPLGGRPAPRCRAA